MKSSSDGAAPFRLTKIQSCHVRRPHRRQPVLPAVEAVRHRARIAPAEVGVIRRAPSRPYVHE